MLCAGRTFADCSDVLPDVSGQIIDMVGVVRIIVDYGTAFGNSGNFTAKQKAKSNKVRAVIRHSQSSTSFLNSIRLPEAERWSADGSCHLLLRNR